MHPICFEQWCHPSLVQGHRMLYYHLNPSLGGFWLHHIPYLHEYLQRRHLSQEPDIVAPSHQLHEDHVLICSCGVGRSTRRSRLRRFSLHLSDCAAQRLTTHVAILRE